MTTFHDVPVRLATPENLAGFGQLLGRVDGTVPVASRFLGDAVELRKPVNFVSDNTTILSLATIRRRPLEVHWMERHHKHTQTFVPLGGRPFVMALARPTTTEFPAVSDIHAFLFDGAAGLVMAVGTWHEFPFALVDDTDVVVILRSETNANLRNVRDNEAEGDDLDKRDLVSRTGTAVRLTL